MIIEFPILTVIATHRAAVLYQSWPSINITAMELLEQK
jgi:hypothetical protein